MEILRCIVVSEWEVYEVVNCFNEWNFGDVGLSEEEFMLFEEDFSDIIVDVYDFVKFV